MRHARVVWLLAIAVLITVVGSGGGASAAPPPPNLTPAAPAWVSASDGTYSDKVRITWAASAGATGYRIYYSYESGGITIHWELTGVSGPAPGTTYDYTTATPGEDYTFSVKACTGSSDCSAVTSDDGYRAILAPTSVWASDGTYADRVQVSWTASEGASYYRLYRSDSADGVKTYIGAPDTTLRSDYSAEPGDTYYYWVQACRDRCSGYSPYNIGYRAILYPAGVQASDGIYPDKVRVSWNAADGADYYQVWRAATEGGSKSLLGSPANASWDDVTAAPGDPYYYWVTSCADVCSGYSLSNSGYRMGPPMGVEASDGTYPDKIRITWTAAGGATYYQVYRASSASGTKSLLGSPTGTLYNDAYAFLMLNTPYYYWVKACNANGCTDYSAYDTGFLALTTNTPTPTRTATRTNTPTRTPTRTRTPTITRTPTLTRTATATPTRRATNTPGPSPTRASGVQRRLFLPIIMR